jgi:hypothetical protein
MNNSSEDKSALIAINPNMLEHSVYQVSDLVSGDNWLEKHNNVHLLSVNVPRKDATILKLSPI